MVPVRPGAAPPPRLGLSLRCGALLLGLLCFSPLPDGADATTRADMDGSNLTDNFEALVRRPIHRLPGSPLTFSAIGDAPYDEAEVPVFLQQLADHRRYSNALFMVHVGDIKSGAEPCLEEKYRLTAEWLQAMDIPVYIVPGDNEWVDCTDPDQGWSYWNAHLLHLEQQFCGTPPMEYQSSRPENFAFVQDFVLFVGVNVVAGSPDDAMVESADWVEAQLAAKRGRVRAAVVFSQAGPSSSRDLFFDRFTAAVAAFGVPVLLVHGDGHSWEYDAPFLVPNLTRVQLERTTSPPVHLTVTTDMTRPFVYERDPWPPGTPVVDNIPCLDAGPSQIVSSSSPAYLFGRGTDDGLPGPLSLGWTRVSGPGTVQFADPSAAVTTAQFERQGTYVLRLAGSDGFAAAEDTITIRAADPSTVPLALDDFLASDEDLLLQVPAPGVLGNDTHGQGFPLTATVLAQPVHGTLALAANGGFTYQPAPQWFGTDAFLYRAIDTNGALDVGMVTLQVNPVNDAPLAANETFSIPVGTPLSEAAPGVLGNDSDADGDLLTASLVTGVTHGSLVLHPDGGFTYTPVVDFIGADGFFYQVSDGLTYSVASATIQVAPVVLTSTPQADAHVRSTSPTSNFGTQSRLLVEQDTNIYNSYLKFNVTGVGVSVRRALLRLYANNGSPDAGDVYLVSNNYQGSALPWTETGLTWTNAPSLGAVPVAGMGSVGDNTWVEWNLSAAVTGNGTYSFAIHNFSTNAVEYSSKEGARPPQLIVETDLPNAPPEAVDDAYAGSEDQVLAVSAPGVMANDSDDPRDVLVATLLSAPATGVLVLAPSGSFTYTPAANFHGSVGFTYRVQDGRGGADTGSATIVIAPVNDLPTAADEAYSLAEDDTLVVAPPGVLGNDTDVEGETLAAVVVTPPAGALDLGAHGGFSYAPTADFHGTTAFVYRASDGSGGSDTATVTLTVTAVNDAPVAAADSFSVDEDGNLEVDVPGVLANDADVDGDTLRAMAVSEPSHGAVSLNNDGSLVYTPSPQFHGTDAFLYALSDGRGGSDTTAVSFRVREVNDAPETANDAYTSSRTARSPWPPLGFSPTTATWTGTFSRRASPMRQRTEW